MLIVLRRIACFLLVAGCDHTSRAVIHGTVRGPANAVIPDELLVISLDQPYLYYTYTNRFGEYVCSIVEFVGPVGTRTATFRIKDAVHMRQVSWGKNDAELTSVDIRVTNLAAQLPQALRDSLDNRYERCGDD